MEAADSLFGLLVKAGPYAIALMLWGILRVLWQRYKETEVKLEKCFDDRISAALAATDKLDAAVRDLKEAFREAHKKSPGA